MEIPTEINFQKPQWAPASLDPELHGHFRVMFEIRAKRLLLRDILETDQEVMHRLRSDPQVTRYINYIKSDTEEQTWGWVQGTIYHNSLTPRLSYNLAIERQSDGQILGWIGIGEAEGATSSVLDFGYALLPVYWGKGYVTETLSAIIHFAFEDLNVEQIYGECDFNNPASARVMEKAGLRQTQQEKYAMVEDKRFVITRVELRSLK